MPEGSKYINAGVMLMNLQLLREVQDVQAVFDYIRENREKLYLLDQDILNGMYGGSTLAIDALLYNLDDRYLLNHNLLTRPSRHVDMDWVKENVVIVHYCGKSKPWKADYKGRLGFFYERYSGCLGEATMPGLTHQTAVQIA